MFLEKLVLIAVAVTIGVTADRPEKLINGRESRFGEFPFFAALRNLNGFTFCGGTIISSQHILTAAHCLLNRPKDQIRVVVGPHNRDDTTPRTYSVAKATFPSEFSLRDPSIKDIGILTLSEPLDPNDRSWSTIKVASREYDAGTDVTLIGIGKDNSGGYFNKLMKITTTLASFDKCQFFRRKLNEKHVCTLPVGGIGTCDADSGGPLVVNGEVVGIISFGFNNCGTGPSVQTKVFKYRDYISQITGLDLGPVVFNPSNNKVGGNTNNGNNRPTTTIRPALQHNQDVVGRDTLTAEERKQYNEAMIKHWEQKSKKKLKL